MSDQPNLASNTKPVNPLANYFRQPKIYIKLPSHGKFYANDSLDKSEIDEYAVYAMTAKDELMFKTPDALMNGQATVEVIKSCVPSIKEPWNMPSIDLDAVLIAIRIATYGENMEVSATCPSCSERNEFLVNLINYLNEVTHFEYDDTIHVDPLTVKIRPYTYKEISKTALKTLEQQKIFELVNDNNISDEDKIEKFGNSFVKLTALTVDVIAGCIVSISSPTETVTDPALIYEFIENAPSDVFNKINERISTMRDQMALRTQQAKCTECGHEWEVSITMDQSNFFAVGS